ncbi:MAG: HEAT repeat domain-containing protein [Planctomycetota bacterium]
MFQKSVLSVLSFLTIIFAQTGNPVPKKILSDLKDKKELVRYKALIDLAEMVTENQVDPQKAIPLIVEAFKDSERSVSIGATRSLGSLAGKEETFPYILEALKHKDVSVRIEIIRILGEVGGDKIVAPISDTLKNDTSKDVRYAAMREIVKITEQEDKRVGLQFVDFLLERLNSDKKLGGRFGFIEALSNLCSETKKPLPTLLEIFKSDPEDKIRSISAKALGEIGPDAKEISPLMFERIKNKKEAAMVRASIAVALMKIEEDSTEVIAILVEMVKEADEGVVRGALEGLRYAGSQGKEAITTITKIIEKKGKNAALAEETYMAITNQRFPR